MIGLRWRHIALYNHNEILPNNMKVKNPHYKFISGAGPMSFLINIHRLTFSNRYSLTLQFVLDFNIGKAMHVCNICVYDCIPLSHSYWEIYVAKSRAQLSRCFSFVKTSPFDNLEEPFFLHFVMKMFHLCYLKSAHCLQINIDSVNVPCGWTIY